MDKDFVKIGEGNQHMVFMYIGEEKQEQFKGKLIRISKPKPQCKLTTLMLNHLNQTNWTPLKKYFCPKQPYEINGIQCEIMDNLFYQMDFAVELKPKTFLPILSNKQINKDLKDIKNTRFYMIQQQKSAKNGTPPSIYDPRKFFSGTQQDLKEAIIQMQVYPENNFRLFQNSKRVNQLQDLQNEDIAEIISSSLINETIIPELKQFFLMLQQLNVTVEEAIAAYESLILRTDQEILNVLQQKAQDFQLATQIFTLMTFSSFQSLSDLSIICGFKTNTENNGQNYIMHKGLKYYYSFHVVDCDLKRLNAIYDYHSNIDQLLSYII